MSSVFGLGLVESASRTRGKVDPTRYVRSARTKMTTRANTTESGESDSGRAPRASKSLEAKEVRTIMTTDLSRRFSELPAWEPVKSASHRLARLRGFVQRKARLMITCRELEAFILDYLDVGPFLTISSARCSHRGGTFDD